MLLEAAGTARAKSRLANAGILAVAAELDFAPPDGMNTDDPNVDAFGARLNQAMEAAIRDPNSAAAVRPIVTRVPAEMIKDSSWMKHLKLHDDTETYAEDARIDKIIGRIATGLDMPREILLGMTDANHWCVDENTEALCKDRGWVNHSDLHVGDMVRTLNHGTGLAEWQPVLDLYRADVVDEPMRRFESRTHSSVTTLNHRWPVLRPRWENKTKTMAREWTTTEQLVARHSIITGASSADQPTERVHHDALVEIAAWFWTEGSIGAGDRVTIAQSHTRNPERVARIGRALTSLFGERSEVLRGSDGPAWRSGTQLNTTSFGGPITVFYLNKEASEVLLAVAPGKRVSLSFVQDMTNEQLETFIDVSCQADGHHYRSGQLDVWQSDPRALDAFEMAVVLSGRAASRQPAHQDGTTVRAQRALAVRPVKAAEEAERKGFVGATDDVIPYTGVLWCPVTPNATWLARRNGRTFFTGNTSWQIDESTWVDHLQPVVQRLCDELAAMFLRPLAKQEKQAGWEDMAVGWDNSKVVNHPDRAKDAKELHDRMVIGDSALRDANGFTDDDKPSDDELNRMLAVKLRQPALIAGELPEKAGTVNIPEAGGPPVATPASQPAQANGTEPANGKTAVQPGPPKGTDEKALQAAAFAGAAEAALIRCRELAGSRLVTKVRNSRNEEWQAAIVGAPQHLVASALGERALLELHAPPAAELVEGGASALAAVAATLGVDHEDAVYAGRLVEAHAARTLLEGHAALPAGVRNRILEIAAGQRHT